MDTEDCLTRIEAQSLGRGSGHRGFVGRYKITPLGIEDLHTDRWCEGTRYTIWKFSSTSEQFFTRCLNMLIAKAPADIFRKMENLERKAYYVPMIKAGDILICLHNQLPSLSYRFLKQGTCIKSEAESIFGKDEPFDASTVNINREEFLSIWLSLTDVRYVANSVNRKISAKGIPEVVFMPIHYLSFDYDGEHYCIMSYGDKSLSRMTYEVLPSDDILSGERLIWHRPWVSIAIMLCFLMVIVAVSFTMIGKVWFYFDSLFSRAVCTAIPAIAIYAVAWYVLRILGWILRHTMLGIECFLAVVWQRHAIKQNFAQKKVDMEHRMWNFPVTYPAAKSYDIDTTVMSDCFDSTLDRLSAMKVVNAYNDN